MTKNWINFRFLHICPVEKCEISPNLAKIHISPHLLCGKTEIPLHVEKFHVLKSEISPHGRFLLHLHTVPNGYPNPTRYPVFSSIPDPTRFNFENLRVAGNPKYWVLPEISGNTRSFGYYPKFWVLPDVSGCKLFVNYPEYPELPGNTRNTRNYPRVKKIPENTRSYFSTLLPDPNPTRYPVFCPIPDPTRY